MIQRGAIDRDQSPAARPAIMRLRLHWGTTMLFTNEIAETYFVIFGVFLLGFIVGVSL